MMQLLLLLLERVNIFVDLKFKVKHSNNDQLILVKSNMNYGFVLFELWLALYPNCLCHYVIIIIIRTGYYIKS